MNIHPALTRSHFPPPNSPFSCTDKRAKRDLPVQYRVDQGMRLAGQDYQGVSSWVKTEEKTRADTTLTLDPPSEIFLQKT